MAKKSLAILIGFPLYLLAGCSSSLPVVQWETTGGPQAQNITDLLIDEENPSMLYAGSMIGEVFTSTDRGQSWSKLSVIKNGQPVHRIVQHPELKNQLYAATGAGLFRSTNSGKDWTEVIIESGIAISCRALAIDPFKTNLLYAGVQNQGVYKSTDGGSTWQKCNIGVEQRPSGYWDVHGITIDVAKPDRLYAATTGAGVIKSTDAGGTWTRLTDGVIYPGSTVTTINLNRKETEKVCIGTDDGNVYRSLNGGATWSLSRRGQERDGILSLVADPLDPRVLFSGTGSGVLVSSDFGESWRGLSPDLPRCATAIVVSSEPTRPSLYVFGQGVGLQHSTDGGRTWVHADRQLGGSLVTSVVANEKGDRLYCIVGSAAFTYSTETRAWESACDGLNGGDISCIAFDADSASILYAATMNGVYRTINGGKSWHPTSPAMRFNRILFLDTHPSIRSRMFLANEQGIQVSSDMGVTWSHTKPYDANYPLRSLTFSPRDAGLIYGATSGRGVVIAADGGFTWKETGYGMTGDPIAAVTLDRHDRHTCYAWTSKGDGFRSTDNGTVWNKFAPPWKPPDNIFLSSDRYNPSNVVALVNGRQLFYSQKGGASWLEIPIDQLPDETTSICFNASTSMLYVATRATGVYGLSLQSILKKLVRE